MSGNKSFAWPEGKRAAITITFDDGRPSQVDRGIPILDRYNLKASFYVSIGNIGSRLDKWLEAVKNGHEIGNHSTTHPCSGNYAPWARSNRALENYTLEQMEADLDDANAAIIETLGVTPVTFAYPCGHMQVGRGENTKSYVPLVARRFIAGRAWRGELPNDPQHCNLAKLSGVEADQKTFDELMPFVTRTLEEGEWLVLGGHDVGDNPKHQVVLADTLDALCRYATDPANGIWFDTLAAVGRYVAKHQESHGT